MGAYSFSGKTALVTGGSRGIGKAIAEAFAGAGARVAFTFHRNAETARQTMRELPGQGHLALKADVGDPEAVKELVEAVMQEFGHIDILVNNAGITRDMLIMRMKDEEWDAVIRTNLNSCFYWARALMPVMARKRWGRVINISSVIGLMGNAGQANYAAAKAGMIGLTKSLAREFAKRGLTANTVAPGFIKTDMTGALNEEVTDAILQQIPLKRFGEAADIANMVTFLASEEAGYITGQTFTVDGGMVM
jgi:3-oxoacyl-[acyl-carrier protein] reductase